MPDTLYMSKVQLAPDGPIYYIKDSEARAAIEQLVARTTFALSTEAANTPLGVTWIKKEPGQPDQPITGTLAPTKQSGEPQPEIYLVPATYQKSGDIDSYDEYVVINTGSEAVPVYVWERLGNTEIDFDALGDLAWHDNVVYSQGTSDAVLGADTTFSVAAMTVSPAGGSAAAFVQSYPGETQQLETVSIKGVAGTENVSQVVPTQVEATMTIFGTDAEASQITTVAKSASKVTVTAATASKAAAGSPITVPQAAASATNVSRINTSSVMATASVDNETLTFGFATVNQASILGIDGSASVTPYTFTDVTVSQVAASDVNFDAVSTNTPVAVPVVSSNASVYADKVAVTNVNVATAAGSNTVVATGKVVASDTNGDSVMTGLGTATTGNAITDVGTLTIPSHSVNVSDNDPVNVAVYGTPSVSVTDSN